MKYSYLLAVALLSCSVSDALAQFTFRGKGGFNLSKMDGEKSDGPGIRKWKEGFHAGLQVQYPVCDGWRVESGMGVEQKGSEVLGFYYGYSLTLNYIEMPVLVTKTFSKRLAISTGFAASYLFHAVFNKSDRKAVNVTSAYKKIDYATFNTLSYQVKGFELGGRFVYGIRKKTTTEFQVDPEIFQQIESFLPSGRNKLVSFYISHRF